MKPLFTSALLVFCLCFESSYTQCPTKNGVTQSCVINSQCEAMRTIMEHPTPENQAIIRQAFCGMSGNTPMLCCPTAKCKTPDGADGTCISPNSCPHVLSMVQQKPISESTRKYIQSLRCEGTAQYNVCCGPPPAQPTTGSPRTLNNKCPSTATPPDPSTNCCGKESGRGGNRIFGGNATEIGEYPWLTVIGYEKENIIKLLCGGALISGRYVLTAAHCVTGDVLLEGTPVNVRLGDYDTSKPGQDCVTVNGGGIDCTDGEVIVPIEKITPHPEYKPYSVRQRNDIALIRLDRVVEYTDFIRPICLPTTDFTEAPPAGLNLYVAGWGAVSDTQKSSDVKLAVSLPYVSYQDCEPPYHNIDARMRLWDGQICAGGANGKDTCKGDSGGPLQRLNGKLIELVGVVSFGITPCARQNYYGVYTKVFKYVPWINSVITE